MNGPEVGSWLTSVYQASMMSKVDGLKELPRGSEYCVRPEDLVHLLVQRHDIPKGRPKELCDQAVVFPIGSLVDKTV